MNRMVGTGVVLMTVASSIVYAGRGYVTKP